MQQSLLALTIGFILDLILGDPHFLWHPVQGIGQIISWTERLVRSIFPANRRGERISGGILVIIVIVLSAGIPAITLFLLYKMNGYAGLIAESVFCYQLLASKSLGMESMKVYHALAKEGLTAGRKSVAMIVGRDTESLSEEGVVKAAVETVAENTSDGIIAPLFYMIIGGSILGFVYKAINTMDSMIGYQNETYQYFGTAAAKLDDIVNYIPARISAGLMILATVFTKWNTRDAVRIFRRDRFAHKSPNAAQTESVMAGALGIRLAGSAYYFGKLVEKPTIGDDTRPVVPEDIRRSVRLSLMTALFGMLIMGALKWLVIFLR